MVFVSKSHLLDFYFTVHMTKKTWYFATFIWLLYTTEPYSLGMFNHMCSEESRYFGLWSKLVTYTEQIIFTFTMNESWILTHCSLETPKRVIGKQCRPRSYATECEQFSHFSLRISKSHSRTYQKLKLDSSSIQCRRVYSIYNGRRGHLHNLENLQGLGVAR